MLRSKSGLPIIGTIGLGRWSVSGLRRVPLPPAKNKAFMGKVPPSSYNNKYGLRCVYYYISGRKAAVILRAPVRGSF